MSLADRAIALVDPHDAAVAAGAVLCFYEANHDVYVLEWPNGFRIEIDAFEVIRHGAKVFKDAGRKVHERCP